MQIYQVNLQCFHLEEMCAFYTEVLEMELIHQTERWFSVRAGSTKLFFEKGETVPYYHLCFRTDALYFEHIFSRLGAESCLLANEEGEYSMFWEGKQAYFTDPDGNILECLERPALRCQAGGWHDVGEVGFPSADVAGMQAKLKPILADRYAEDSSSFAFYGDDAGVLVLVKEGRCWYPTDRGAEIHPITLIVSGSRDAHYMDDDLPYEIQVRGEWEQPVSAVQVRIARPTNQLEKIKQFYGDGLGLKELGGFHHEGYKGIMYGLPDRQYHLEFTQTDERHELPAPAKDHLLVLYIPDLHKLNAAAARLSALGYQEAEPENPYWGRGGITIEDPDGWRIVLMNTAGI
ncbi:VOC family protein [Bacillus infantis]|uniref:VOC family protein n=2 Tax=Bacillus infantis TaxID=324767 RepID=A0A5D4RAY3_9BACI|nr:VOC family protein [Bacillus infantis]